MKIDKLTLKNFKFFYGEKTLNFESKNVLLYGENGSGKSSIYWALYTLLNNSNSADVKIQKYFMHRNKKRLLNRYIEETDDGHIAIALSNTGEFKLSKEVTDITNYHRGTFIKEASIASDFINYKLLAKLYDFKHGQQINLFDLFESDIFDYLPYESRRNYTNVWEMLKRFEESAPIKNSKQYRKFKANIDSFNDKFSSFIDSIGASTNDILHDVFKLDYMDINISYKPLIYRDNSAYRANRYLKHPKINISMKLNNNVPVERNKNIDQPHTYLNEAKLTAIALSIRFAILRTRAGGSHILKILVLDDLLISLDMSNRDIVVNMLLEDEYLKDYQIIMLTHDRAFYERSRQIFDYKAKGMWKYFEMYLDSMQKASQLTFSATTNKQLPSIKSANKYFGDIEIPYIREFGQEYGNKERAEEHFRNRDYPACANYLRKEVEKLYYKNLDLGKIESIMELSRKVDNYEKIETCFPILMKTLKAFKNCKNIPDKEVRAKKCIIFADKVEKAFDVVYEIIKSDEFFDIGLMKDHILNPQSHDDFTKPLYKKELEDALRGVELLQQAVEANILNRMAKKREELKKNVKQRQRYRRNHRRATKPFYRGAGR